MGIVLVLINFYGQNLILDTDLNLVLMLLGINLKMIMGLLMAQQPLILNLFKF